MACRSTPDAIRHCSVQLVATQDVAGCADKCTPDDVGGAELFKPTHPWRQQKHEYIRSQVRKEQAKHGVMVDFGSAAVRVGVAIVAQRVQEERLCGSQRHLEHYANATDMARWVAREGARWERWARRRRGVAAGEL